MKPRIPEVIEVLAKIKEIHERKNQDYSRNDDPFSNFHYSSYVSRGFSGIHSSFASLIGTKLARLAVLLEKSDAPQNESIEDTFIDLSTYCILWTAYYMRTKPDAKLRSRSRKSERKTHVRRRSTRAS